MKSCLNCQLDIFDVCFFLVFILDNSETAEAKGLFEANFSHIYHILYDSFVQAEANLRQRGLCLMTNTFDMFVY